MHSKTCALPILLGAWIACAGLNASAQYTNGIYAEFNTSMGSFTCRLDHVVAPKAVANFIGLATGERAWLDVPSGAVRTTPFYNGTTFHRVIKGFMSQGGSRNALGTDGPGYSFVDEFNPGAAHDRFGVLSMANSGPDSNGSQFFITAGPQPHLNNVHTVFGRLYGGSNVVYAINDVATNANAKPLVDVVVQGVTIRRIGPDAQNFNIHAQGLPVVTNLNLGIAKSSSNMTLTFTNRLDVENRFYFSTNLAAWSGQGLGFETAAPVMHSVMAGSALPVQFFRAVQIQYAGSLHVPKNLLNRTLSLSFNNGVVVTIQFNLFGGGTFSSNTGASGGVAYSWIQDAYRGRFKPLFLENFAIMELHLDFDTAGAGTFKGSGIGTFTVSP